MFCTFPYLIIRLIFSSTMNTLYFIFESLLLYFNLNFNLASNGKRISSVTNTQRHRQYLHFYDRLEDIIAGMEKALTRNY